MGLQYTYEIIVLGPSMQTQPVNALHYIISMAHLDVFKVEGHFAVFTVEGSCFTFSLIMSVLLRTKD